MRHVYAADIIHIITLTISSSVVANISYADSHHASLIGSYGRVSLPVGDAAPGRVWLVLGDPASCDLLTSSAIFSIVRHYQQAQTHTRLQILDSALQTSLNHVLGYPLYTLLF